MIIAEGKHYLYRHIRLDTNQPFYIGIGTKPNWNATSHEKMYRRAFTENRRSDFWKRVVNKYGYKVEILLESNNPDFIKEKEVEFILLYGRNNDGGKLCNITKGGDGTHGFSRTPEINKNIGLKISGKNNKKSITAYKYDLKGNLVESYDSFNLAAKVNKMFKQNILDAKNKGFICGGFYWADKKYENFATQSPLYISPKDRIINRGNKIKKPLKPLIAYNKDNSIFKEFQSLDEATLFFRGKVTVSNKNSCITHSINGLKQYGYGYKWAWK